MPGREKRGGAKLGKHNNPLGDDLNADRFAQAKKIANEDAAPIDDDWEQNTSGFLLSAKTTKKIFQRAREQLSQIEEEKEVEGLQQQQQNEEEEEEEGRALAKEGDLGLADILRSQHPAPSPFYAPPQEEEEEEDAVVLEYDEDDDDTASVLSELQGEESGLMRMAASAQDIHPTGVSGDIGVTRARPGTQRPEGGKGEHHNPDAKNAPTSSGVGALETYYGINEEEARLLERFQPASRVQSRHLSGIIMEKIREQALEEQQQQQQEAGGTGGRGSSSTGITPVRSAAMAHFIDQAQGASSAAAARRAGGGRGGGTTSSSSLQDEKEASIDPRVARVYVAVGGLLKRYTSGKVPKAFKVLPNVENWEALLLLTKPEQWSPHAVYQATRIFSSHLNERMAQRFYAAILLPIIHERIVEEKKLHPALYMAVRKALFKPVAFFKGFLLPLATDEECTLREALIIASILQRSHLPPIPTAVALVKIAQQPFRGPCTVFLRVLIDKQMALPYQAIDALVAYFHRFIRTHSHIEGGSGAEDEGKGAGRRTVEVLPVLWHQTLLLFVQRYKNDLTIEQVHLLLQVCSIHFHYLISPEIKRELGMAQRTLMQQQAGNGGMTGAPTTTV